MKKTMIIAALALLMVGVSSCNKQKDGVYNPKQKISAVYEEYRSTSSYYNSSTYTWEDNTPSVTPFHKAEEWTWDGKKLQEIRYFDSDGSIEYSMLFTYDGKRLSRVDYKDYDNLNDVWYTTYEYDGKELATITTYEGGRVYSTCAITHADKKISEIVETYYDYEKGARGGNYKATLRMLFPVGDMSERLIEKCEAKAKTKGTSTYVARISLTWTDNNVTRIIYKWSDGETEMQNMTYDTKKNPYYGFMALGDQDEGFDPWNLSENNVIADGGESPYTYQYDKNDYPTSRMYSYSYREDYYRYTSTSTTTFEYVK